MDRISWKKYFFVSGMGLAVILAAAVFQQAPGFMDAEYYASIARRLAEGRGLTEPFIWNYLQPVEELPSPAFAYWMPMPALVAAAGYFIFGTGSFLAAQSGFLLLAAFIPPLTSKLTLRICSDERAAIFSGLLAAFSGFYVPFLATTDSFAIYMLIGLAILLSTSREREGLKVLVLGMLAGVMHLTRAEGILWLGLTGVGLHLNRKIQAKEVGLLFGGYLLLVGPWMVRNLQSFGTLLSPAGSKVLWMTSYDALYSYPSASLNIRHFLNQGLGKIFQDRLWAAWLNMKTALAVQGEILLVPLIVIGAVKYREKSLVQTGLISWGVLFLVMTVIFPFPGSRGGFFHAGASLQSLQWALAGAGLAAVISWGAENRGWRPEQAWKVLGAGWVMLAVFLTGFLFQQRVIGEEIQAPIWKKGYQEHQRIASTVEILMQNEEPFLMVNNPPGLYFATGLSSAVIPDGGPDVLERAALDVGANLVVLENNHPQGLVDLYLDPQTVGQLEYFFSDQGRHYFRVGKSRQGPKR